MPKFQRMLECLPEQLREAAAQIKEKCKALGYEAYIVGGAVRDMLLKTGISDVDITVVGDTGKLAGALDGSFGYEIKTHPSFMTVNVSIKGGYSLDIATARREVYTNPASLPMVYLSNIYDDLKRRDFTINAMAVSLDGFELLDFFGGFGDLQRGLIKVLHEKSFVDDPTRILRGIRLEKRYGFRMDEKTEKLMKDSIRKGYPLRLSSDRLLNEIELILSQPQFLSLVRRMEETGLWKAISGERAVPPSTFLKLERVRKCDSDKRLLFRVLALIEDTPNERVAALFERHISRYKKLMAYRNRENHLQLPVKKKPLENEMLYELFSEIDEEILEYLYASAETECFRKNITAYIQRIKDFKFYFDGNTLKSIGVEPGPRYKSLLGRARQKAVERNITDRENQIYLLKEMLKKGE
jgi:tRNA nucleotidyltransferase (CCA-adding enzyme)